MTLLTGTSGNDTLVGTIDAETLKGLEGEDLLKGEGGDDRGEEAASALGMPRRSPGCTRWNGARWSSPCQRALLLQALDEGDSVGGGFLARSLTRWPAATARRRRCCTWTGTTTTAGRARP